MSQITIKKLSINLDKNDLPQDIFAQFSDGRWLTLDYQQTWQQCFATLSGNKRTGRRLETSYRYNLPTDIETTKLTRRDWEQVCYRYYEELKKKGEE